MDKIISENKQLIRRANMKSLSVNLPDNLAMAVESYKDRSLVDI